MNKGMIRTTKVLQWLLSITGVIYALKMYGVLPLPHPECMLKKVHVVLGVITLVTSLWHCIDHRKWYKAWLKGRIRNNMQEVILTKWTTGFFALMIGVLLLDWIWPSKLYATIHIITAFIWIAVAARHCKSKSRRENNC